MSLISEYERSRARVKLKFVQNSFDSKLIWFWFKKEKIFEKFDENQFKFDSFDSTPTIGWSQIFINWIQFENLQFDWFEKVVIQKIR